MGKTNNNRFYRLRGLDKIFDYKELENQEIYFAPINELNDPMEAIKDIIFEGDTIAWENLLKHLILCLANMLLTYSFVGEDYSIKRLSKEDINVFITTEDLPTQKYKDLINSIFEEVFNYEDFNRFIKILADRSQVITDDSKAIPLKKDELKLHLSSICPGIHEVFSRFLPCSNGAFENRTPNKMLLDKSIESIKSFKNLSLKEDENEFNQKIIEVICNTHQCLKDEFMLNNNLSLENWGFIVYDFADAYIDKLVDLTFPEVYSASFLESYENSSIWAHYADGHKGICLIFEADDENNLLLHSNLPHKRNQKEPYHFYKMDYNSTFPQDNFFENLGRLPKGKLINWFQGEDGTISDKYQLYAKENFVKQYWDNMFKHYLLKTPEWKHEFEYRLSLLGRPFSPLPEKENRKLQYDFKHLKGIIFGMNTPENKKREIINIIKKKCPTEYKETFEFYQAFYSRDKCCESGIKGGIDTYQLNINLLSNN